MLVEADAPGVAVREIVADVDPASRALIAGIGRTEDVRFSPDNRRLAIAAFFHDAILVADVTVEPGHPRPRVVIRGAEELRGPGIDRPHGVEFADPETLVVASRGQDLAVYRLGPRPAGAVPDGTRSLARVGPPPGTAIAPVVESGSVRRDHDTDRILVCDNARHRVTRHRVERDGGGPRLAAGEIVLDWGLDLPDSLATSPDGSVLAVSNHNRQCVVVYRRDEVAPDARPCAVLRGVVWPHGLRFTPAGDLLVADAGRPFVHRFVAGPGGWSGVRYPDRTVRIMSEETFRRGHHNALEGGAKGLDLDATGSVVATTCAEQPLALFALDDLLDDAGDPPDEGLRLAYEHAVLEFQGAAVARAVHEEEIRTDHLRARTAAAERRTREAEQRAAEAEAHAAASDAARRALEQTKTFRIAAPARRAYAWVRGRRRPT